MNSIPRILVVDDERMNRELIAAMLEGCGYEIVEATTGEEALERSVSHPPDLVLCDVMMPGINGFEVTRWLKSEALRMKRGFLPIIIITALGDRASRLQALAAGADELLGKVLDKEELRLRIANMLALRQKELALAQRNEELAELHRFREEMSALLVHDLKNPMTVVVSNLVYAHEQTTMPSEVHSAIGDALEGAQRVVHLITTVLEIARLESTQIELLRVELPLATMIEDLMEQHRRPLRSRGVTMEITGDSAVVVKADRMLMTRVFDNLIDNAVRHTPNNGRICCDVSKSDGRISVTVTNTGKPIPPAAQDRLFHKHVRGDDSGAANFGFGLYFCKLAVEAHGGSVRVEKAPRLDAAFTVELPAT